MELKERLYDDMKRSLKSGDKLRLGTMRMVISEIRYAEIAAGGEISEEETVAVITREARRRREAIEEFEKGGRDDLVARETAELEILREYLPEQMTEDELRLVIDETIRQSGATSPSDLGKVMGSLMPRVKGRADGKLANRIAREILEER